MLTREELDVIIKTTGKPEECSGVYYHSVRDDHFEALISTAHSAIPTPVGDAPKDSTELDHIECYIGSAFDHLCGATESTWDQQVSKACERLVCARKLISKYKSQLNQTSQ